MYNSYSPCQPTPGYSQNLCDVSRLDANESLLKRLTARVEELEKHIIEIDMRPPEMGGKLYEEAKGRWAPTPREADEETERLPENSELEPPKTHDRDHQHGLTMCNG